MANGFHNLSMRGSDLPDNRPEATRSRGGAALSPPSNEAAAREYLDRALQQNRSDPTFRGLAADERPERVPALTVVEELRSPFGENSVVRFGQFHNRIPVYGARATVELAPDQTLSHLDVDVADIDDLESVESPIPSLSAQEAVTRLADLLGVRPEDGVESAPRELVYYRDPENERFVLCWLVRRVPVAPPSAEPQRALDDTAYVGGWEAPANRLAFFDYFIDASTGRLVAALSASQSFDAPIECKGLDEDGAERVFDGRAVTGGFAMDDPVRFVTSHDFGLEVYSGGFEPNIGKPVRNATTDWADTNRAAVAAHYHATVVHDFIESVLHRQGVDGKRMALTSVVNCTKAAGDDEWFNAQWTGRRMIYGQSRIGGRLVSLARHLDVIAHELAHGVTQNTARLEYKFESGALNESMSDIFGIIIANLEAGRTSVSRWKWEIGAGLGENGGPLRDMRDPSRGSPPQPAHTKDRVNFPIERDFGGVHFNSGIHNRAAHLVLTAKLSRGKAAFTPHEVARFYYFVLLELTSNSGFADARRKLVDIVRATQQGDARVGEMVSAVEDAYDAVGIS